MTFDGLGGQFVGAVLWRDWHLDLVPWHGGWMCLIGPFRFGWRCE